jgi:hypothetical protein
MGDRLVFRDPEVYLKQLLTRVVMRWYVSITCVSGFLPHTNPFETGSLTPRPVSNKERASQLGTFTCVTEISCHMWIRRSSPLAGSQSQCRRYDYMEDHSNTMLLHTFRRYSGADSYLTSELKPQYRLSTLQHTREGASKMLSCFLLLNKDGSLND